MAVDEDRLWKINCMEDKYPGMWQRWYKHQCVAVGWHVDWGYHLKGPTAGGRGWQRTRKALQDVQQGDWIAVSLRGHKVGRIGQVVAKAIEDGDWEPLVPVSSQNPEGEMGRRIQVRWDLTVGPEHRDFIVVLPDGARFTTGELRSTLTRIKSHSLSQLKEVMRDEANWEGLLARFRYEKALSNYIATYPHRLEDGLAPHPDTKVREKVFTDRTRLDVLLIDRDDKPVVVECKQHPPNEADLDQLRRYMALLQEETGEQPRGILVHGGAKKISESVRAASATRPAIEVVQYSVQVDFARSG